MSLNYYKEQLHIYYIVVHAERGRDIFIFLFYSFFVIMNTIIMLQIYEKAGETYCFTTELWCRTRLMVVTTTCKSIHSKI